MQVKDVMTKHVVSVNSEDPLSRALSKMKQKGVHQVPVIDDNLVGMLLLKKIVTKAYDTKRTKVAAIMDPPTIIDSNKSVEDAAQMIINSGMRAVPVMEKGVVVGIVSETDLMKIVNLGHKVEEVMAECEYVNADDDIGKVKKLMEYKNVSRVPVFENGKPVGIIDTLDMIKVIEGEKSYEPPRVKEKGFKEKVSMDKIKAKTIMRPPVIVSKDKTLKEISVMLYKNEEVLVENGGIYIITPKDVLELLVKKPEKGVYVQIANLGKEDPFVAAKIDQATTALVKKIGRSMEGIESLVLHIDRYEKQGKKIRYAVRTRLLTPLGLFVSHSQGWNLVDTAQDALSKLEREIMKKYGRVQHHEKEKRTKKYV